MKLLCLKLFILSAINIQHMHEKRKHFAGPYVGKSIFLVVHISIFEFVIYNNTASFFSKYNMGEEDGAKLKSVDFHIIGITVFPPHASFSPIPPKRALLPQTSLDLSLVPLSRPPLRLFRPRRTRHRVLYRVPHGVLPGGIL